MSHSVQPKSVIKPIKLRRVDVVYPRLDDAFVQRIWRVAAFADSLQQFHPVGRVGHIANEDAGALRAFRIVKALHFSPRPGRRLTGGTNQPWMRPGRLRRANLIHAVTAIRKELLERLYR